MSFRVKNKKGGKENLIEHKSLPSEKEREEEFKYKPSLLNPNIPQYLLPVNKISPFKEPEKEIIVFDKINKKWILVKQTEEYLYKF